MARRLRPPASMSCLATVASASARRLHQEVCWCRFLRPRAGRRSKEVRRLTLPFNFGFNFIYFLLEEFTRRPVRCNIISDATVV